VPSPDQNQRFALDGAAPRLLISIRSPYVHDRIVLLSGGQPTDTSFPVSKLMSPGIILGHVRRWNRGKEIVIDCISIGNRSGSEFMRVLAAENGGAFVDR
jgi:hypothetical protein